MSKRIVIGMLALVLVLAGAGGLWAWKFRGVELPPDPARQAAKALAELPKEQRQQKFDEVTQGLSDRQRWRVRGELFRKEGEEAAHTYATLPLDQRTAFLDQQIKEMDRRMEERRRQRAARQAEQAAQGTSGGGGPGGAGGGSGNAGQAAADPNAGPGGGPGNRRGGPGGPGGDRGSRGKQRLLTSTPQQRAERTLYMQDLQQRRTQLGLPSFGPRR